MHSFTMSFSMMLMMICIVFLIGFVSIIGQRKKEDELDRDRREGQSPKQRQSKKETPEEMDQHITQQDREAVRKFIKEGAKVHGIKYLRDRGNYDLKSAKEYVDYLEETHSHVSAQEDTAPSLTSDGIYPFSGEELKEMAELKERGKVVNAISVARAKSGWGLKEAKEFVDELHVQRWENLSDISKSWIEKMMEHSLLNDRQIATIVFCQVQYLKEVDSSKAREVLRQYTGWDMDWCQAFVEEVEWEG